MLGNVILQFPRRLQQQQPQFLSGTHCWCEAKVLPLLPKLGGGFKMFQVLHRNLTWNLKMMVSKRNLLFQGLLSRFHVKFQGCICLFFIPTWGRIPIWLLLYVSSGLKPPTSHGSVDNGCISNTIVSFHLVSDFTLNHGYGRKGTFFPLDFWDSALPYHGIISQFPWTTGWEGGIFLFHITHIYPRVAIHVNYI